MIQSQEYSSNTEKEKRVLFLTSNFPRWKNDSTTPFILDLANDISESGWKVDILAPHAENALKFEKFNDINVHRFQYWPSQKEQTLCYNGGALLNLRGNKIAYLKAASLVFMQIINTIKLIQKNQYDVIHAHWMLPQGFSAIVAKFPFKIFKRKTPKIITTIHGGDAFSLNKPIFKFFKKIALSNADIITVNSSATEKAISEITPKNKEIKRIPMGVNLPDPDMNIYDLKKQYNLENKKIITFIGRFVQEKGPEDAIRALKIVKNNNVKLVLIGDGPDKEKIKSTIENLRLQDKVILTGWLDKKHISSWLNASDIFIGPSKKAPDGWVEAQGLTFAEAMLSKTAVIASNSGGIPDTVQNNKTGILVHPGDILGFATAIDDLLDNHKKRMNLVNQGFEYAKENLTHQKTAHNFLNLYEERV